MTTNFITYNIALTPENADLIDQANALIIGSAMGASVTTSKQPAEKKAAAKKPAEKKAAAKKEEPAGPSFDDLKNAVKAAKSEHGEDFVTGVLDALGVKENAALPKRCSSVTEEDRQAVIDNLAAGPGEAEGSDDDDWGDDDGAGDDDITAEAVTAAVKAYGKENTREEAKAIMNKHGAKLLNDIPDCSAKQLSAMFKALT